MSTDVSGMIECRPLARIFGEDDEDAVWHAAIDLFLLNTANGYSALACLFGVRNSFGFRPLSESRGFPTDASEELRETFHASGGAQDAYGTTWISWAELVAADWDETDRSGSRSRSTEAGAGTPWAPVWDVMRALAGVHGAGHVRLVVWFE
ncbi:hypothetical protein ACFV28_07545 [Streptomyces sp. NPDC059720]|uniref:hypothetical protein n=1 Tax=Streptomyces sp. NPDC059720 TaxID=3346924 RepID=UPI0036CF8543